MKGLKRRLRDGETLLGCFLNLGSALTAEIAGRAGFDFVVIDLEHGSGGEGDVLGQLQALEATSAGAIARVESHARQRAHRVLDLGAEGIMFPRVGSREEARAAVAGLRYPPHGVRGVAAANRACGFGTAQREYMASVDDVLLGVVQIESQESLDAVHDIASVDGVDVLFIGPQDLTQSLGILGQYDHPRYNQALETTAAAARGAGKSLGILMAQPDDFGRYRSLGFSLIACGSDGTLLNHAARRQVEALTTERDKSVRR
jgi:2-keto-3-deoxy-L-rhamnonate aldolase RhmA